MTENVDILVSLNQCINEWTNNIKIYITNLNDIGKYYLEKIGITNDIIKINNITMIFFLCFLKKYSVEASLAPGFTISIKTSSLTGLVFANLGNTGKYNSSSII